MGREERDTFLEKLGGVLDDMRLVLAEMHRNINTINSSFLIGANRVTFSVAAGSTSGVGQQPTTVGNSLLGWSVRETTGANPATVIFRDGDNASADEVGSVTLLPNESTRDLFPFGVSLINGLYLDCTAGAVAGAVYLRNT